MIARTATSNDVPPRLNGPLFFQFPAVSALSAAAIGMR